jgi:dihydrofolate reductase
MRKLIFQQFLSLDGYAADKDHETKFFDQGEFDKESDEDLLAEMERFDNILLGANTYKMFVEYWPTDQSKDQIVADKLNSIPKIVFSSTLAEAPWGKWKPAQIERDNAVEAVKQLKKKKGNDMVLWGSISVSRDLINAGLVDEYHFRIVPVILGSGISQFENLKELKLTLVKSKTYSNGLQLLQYLPK